MLSTYLGYQVYANNMAQSLVNVSKEGSNATAQAYYNANIGKATTVDDFLSNYKLYSYAMQASGLSDMTYAKAFMRKVLTSDLSDPSSFVNKLTDTRFKAFAQQFSFAGANSVAAQSAAQQSRTVALYTAKTGSGSINGLLATNYYEENIGKVKSVKDLENDSQLLDYVMTAYGLDPTTIDKGSYTASTSAENQLAAVLESDPSDPNSTASQIAAGNVDASGIPVAVQSQAQENTLSATYTSTYGRSTDLIYYENTIGSVRSIDGFLADPKLVKVALQAYGLDPNAYATADVKRILTSNLDDPMSVANQLGPGAVGLAKAFNFTTSASATSPYVAMAQDFNFDSSGAIATGRVVQSTINIAAAEAAYQAQAKTDASSQAAAKTESSYYTSQMTSATSLDGILADPRLVAYIKTAYGMAASTSTTTLRQILTSDLTNPKSVASTMGTTARKLAAAFNFSTSGTVTRVSGGAQTAKAAQITDDNFLEQNLEDEAGQTNQGVELALYFRRKVMSGAVTNAYAILADPALLKVTQTALSLPSSSSKADIDLQAKQITNRLNLSDLTNPAKLNRFISQFANLYDLANAASSGTSDVTTLFGG